MAGHIGNLQCNVSHGFGEIVESLLWAAYGLAGLSSAAGMNYISADIFTVIEYSRPLFQNTSQQTPNTGSKFH